MYEQEYKIEYGNTEVFFFKHSLITALQHALNFIERNKGKYKMNLYRINKSPYGPRWQLIKTISKEE